MSVTLPTQTPIEAAITLAAAIKDKRQQRLEAEAHKAPWKPRRHYASNLSSCVRSMVYAHTHWQDKEPFSAAGVAAMEDGNHEEKLIITELMADGFDVVETQVQLDDDRYWVKKKLLNF